MSFQTLKTFWPSIFSKGTTTSKVQKGNKDIIKMVHVTSLVQPKFNDATRINKYNDLIQQFVE